MSQSSRSCLEGLPRKSLPKLDTMRFARGVLKKEPFGENSGSRGKSEEVDGGKCVMYERAQYSSSMSMFCNDFSR